MRRREKEITDRQEIDDVLNRARICHLGLVDGQEPYVVPLNYGYDGQCLYFHAAVEGRKLDIIRSNNLVCFEVEVDEEVIPGKAACDWGTRYRSVIGLGRAKLIEDEAGKRQGFNIIMAHYGSDQNDYLEKNLNRSLVLKVEIESLSGKKSGF